MAMRQPRLRCEALEDRTVPARVGYYDFLFGEGVADQVPPITTAGHDHVKLSTLSQAELAPGDESAEIQILFAQNSASRSYSAEWTSNLNNIFAAVEDGLVLILHDNRVTNATTILPGASSITLIKDDQSQGAKEIEIVDETSVIADGPGGKLNDNSLDNGSQSSHGYALASTLPDGSEVLLTRNDSSQAVTFSYPYGDGYVIYSTIPLANFLNLRGNSPEVVVNMRDIYAPNILGYAAGLNSPDPRPEPDQFSLDEDSTLEVAAPGLLANDDNPVGTIVRPDPFNGPNHGAVSLNPDGSFSYTPDLHFNGTDSFVYVVETPAGKRASAQVTIEVNSVDDPPQGESDIYFLLEDTTLMVDAMSGVLANDSDPDGDSLQAELVEAPSEGALEFAPDGSFTYTPPSDFADSVFFEYRLSDGALQSGPFTVELVIEPVNDLPVAVDDQATTQEDTAIKIDVLANDFDVDGDFLGITQAIPSVGEVTIGADSQLDYTPTPDFFGLVTIDYTIDDGNGGTATARVNLTVTPVNDNPVANDDSATTLEDTAVTISALANDVDVDGDALSISQVEANWGSVRVDPSGTLTFTPSENGFGEALVEYTITDGNGGSDTGIVTVQVAPVNDAPEAIDDTAMGMENGSLLIPVLANDQDVDNDVIRIIALGPAANGTVEVQGGEVLYTPTPGFAGDDQFTYTIADDEDASATANVFISLVAVNDPPQGESDIYFLLEDTTLMVDAMSGVLANDSDPDGDSLQAELVEAPSEGALEFAPDGSFTYTPPSDFADSVFFEYRLSDGALQSGPFTVELVIEPVNDLPVAVDDQATTQEDTAIKIDVLANDFDVDGDFLGITQAIPSVGEVTIGADSQLDYTPTPDFFGLVTIDYTIDDGNGGTATARVNLTITAENDPPQALDDRVTTEEDKELQIDVLNNDFDVDGDLLTIVSVNSPQHGTVNIVNNSLQYIPNPNYFGADAVVYTIADETSSATATVDITVTSVNDVPIANDDLVSTDEDAPILIDVLFNDQDVDDDLLEILEVTELTGGTASIESNQIQFVPSPGFVGEGSFRYTIDDGNGGTDSAEVTVDVQPVNDPPQANNDSVETLEDTPIAMDVLVNDVDPDNDPLTVVTAEADIGDAELLPDGRINYSPPANFNGTATITYTIRDPDGETDEALVEVTVIPVNDAPVANDDQASTTEDSGILTIPVLLNDEDIDGDPLSVELVNQPSGGVVSIEGTQFLFVPDTNFFGTSAFTYLLSDGRGGSSTANVTITITPVNDAPIAEDDVAATPEDTPATIDVLANDRDVDNDTLTITSATASLGNVTIRADGRLNYTPDLNFSGKVEILYTIEDGAGGMDTAMVELSVNPVNDAPTMTAPESQTIQSGNSLEFTSGNNNSITLFDVDAADGAMRLSLEVAQGSLRLGNMDGVKMLDGSGQRMLQMEGTLSILNRALQGLMFTPDLGFSGETMLSITVDDQGNTGGSPLSEHDTVLISVEPGGDGDAMDDHYATVDCVPISGNVLDNDPYPTREGLIVTLVADPEGGEVQLDQDGRFTYTPRPGYSGTDKFIYQVSDAFGNIDDAAVTIQVEAIPKDHTIGMIQDVLVIVGNNRSNHIKIVPVKDDPSGRSGLTLTTDLNGWNPVTFTEVRFIKVLGKGGNDRIKVASSVEIPAFVAGAGGADSIILGQGDNIVHAGSGYDSVITRSGNDTIDTGSGSSYVDVGDGDNLVTTGNGYQLILSGKGDDHITTAHGVSYIRAGHGDNVIDAGQGFSNISTGNGDDVITTGNGGSTIRAGDGANLIRSGWGYNDIWTGDGNDVVEVAGGGSFIYVGAGDDFVVGGQGVNKIHGGLGNDVLLGSTKRDYLYGGKGTDLLVGGLGADCLHGNSGEDMLIGGEAALLTAEDFGELMNAWAADRDDPRIADRLEIVADNQHDFLFGNSGTDEFWADSRDRTDAHSGERVN